MKLSVAALFATLATLVAAAPATPLEGRSNSETSGAYSTLSTSDYSAWATSAAWATTAYCTPTQLAGWGCGDNCNAVPGASGVTLIKAGGDNTDIPYWYVATNATHTIVGIRGTNTGSISSWANDLGTTFTTPSSTYFPGSPGKVHDGFYGTFTDMRADMLAAVQTGVAAGKTQVLVVGHSLGAAVGNLMSVYLQNVVSGATVTARLFGLPRVGNPDWANYVDGIFGTRSQFMTVYNDLVPHLPTMLMGFRHSSNEVWMINTSAPTVWRACTGQENDYCSDQIADKLAAKISSAHSGPYAGITMGC